MRHFSLTTPAAAAARPPPVSRRRRRDHAPGTGRGHREAFRGGGHPDRGQRQGGRLPCG